MSSQVNAAIDVDLLLDALRLTFGKVVHACVVGVVHEVVNGILPLGRARVSARGAPKGGRGFRGTVIHGGWSEIAYKP